MSGERASGSAYQKPPVSKRLDATGPRRDSRYCDAGQRRPVQLGVAVVGMRRRCTRRSAKRSRWSWRFEPTPGRSKTGATPTSAQMVGRADARQHQQPRRADRARGQDHLALARRSGCPSIMLDADARGPSRPRCAAPATPVRDGQVPASAVRREIGHRRRGAARVALGQLVVADAVLRRAVQVVDCAGCRARRRRRNRPRRSAAARAAARRRAGRPCRGSGRRRCRCPRPCGNRAARPRRHQPAQPICRHSS